MKDAYQIQIVRRYKVNQIGKHLLFLGIFSFLLLLFLTAFNIEYSNEELIYIFGICGFITLIGFFFDRLRGYENALMQFIPEGIIMKTREGYFPIKYGQIKKMSISDFSFDSKKSYFYLFTEDSRKFEIKVDLDIYEGLINIFPEKDRP